MGNEGSIASDTESQVSDWQSIYSVGSRAGRRSSLGSMRLPSPMEPPEPDLSHLSPAEVVKIREVIGRAKEMKDAENKRIRKLEEEYVEFTADVERRTSEVAAAVGEMKKDSPLCPICLTSELIIQEGKMQDGQNVCADCGNLTCLRCGSMEQSVTSKELEWVCHVCHKRRQLVLSSGLWHPGCDVDEDIPLAHEVECRLQELEAASVARGPLTRSASVDGPRNCADGGCSSLQRQMSLPDYHMPTTYSTGHMLEVIQESGFSDQMSDNASPEPPYLKAVSPVASDEMKKSASSTNSASIRGMGGQPISRSESEYSDGISDVDMEDGSMFRSGTDGISPDDGSDDYSFMSIGSSDDNTSIQVRRKHRPKSLNLSRSVSGTSSEDETSDSALSTDVESKYANSMQPPQPDPHELRIALAASAFVEDMRGVDVNTETDDEVAHISSTEHTGEKVRFSPSAPVSPSWREGLDSPPFSPRRRDSYPGKRRGSSPVSPKDKRFTYSDASPPSRQLSLEDVYDKEGYAASADQAFVFPQRQSPKSPVEEKDSFYGNSGDMSSFDRPTSNLKKSKPFYSLEDAAMDINDTTTVMDLATYAATVASNTANLTSMSISPTMDSKASGHGSPEGRRGMASPTSPSYNATYPDDSGQEDDHSDTDIELADPSQKSIDYQGSKRQKARPPTTDWSPVIDLSPILDVSPSLEEAEQAEMLAQQQAERERQASREDDEYAPMNTFVAIGDATADTEYLYYGLKRYEVVEDINELVMNQNNGHAVAPGMVVNSGSSKKTEQMDGVKSNKNGACVANATANTANMNTHDIAVCESVAPTSVTIKSTVSQPHTGGCSTKNSISDSSVSASRKPKSGEQNSKDQPNKNDTSMLNSLTEESNSSAKCKTRRKLPEPTADIVATQKQPVPKPRRKDRTPDASSNNPAPPKPARTTRPDLKEPSRNPPIYSQSTLANKVAPQGAKSVHNKHPALQKQNSEERKRTAKEMKAKPDPLIMSHLEIEEASASPQYKVLESPPSPENKAVVRREYSDSTSVSPSSSPDRESFLYPSPVTPPDSDSSPPKPHSPSSGTDFEDEFILVCDDSAQSNRPKEKIRNANVPPERRHSSKSSHASRDSGERGTTSSERDVQHHSKPKQQQSPQGRESRDHKQKEMKKIRRKLPPIPPDEDVSRSVSPKPKQRPVPARKPPPRTDHKVGKKKCIGSSASDDSSMNEDDKEVASITRKKQINNLDKPSIDKKNGNYIKAKGFDSNHTSKIIEANIPPDIDMKKAKTKEEVNKSTYFNETDAIIDELESIYGEPITTAMKGLKRRLQDELRRVTEGRRRKIDEIEELRALKIQLGELKIGAANKSSNSNSNGKKRNSSNSRTSPQMINRRARHKRQSSDPMVAKFSPIKEDKDIESEIQIIALADPKSSRTTDDSSQSGISDTDSIRSEPIKSEYDMYKKIKPSDYAKMFFNNYHAQSAEILDKTCKTNSPQLISSHSEGNLPLDSEDEETRQREEKRRELQFEIEKRRKQLAEREAKLKEARSSLGATNKHLAQSCDEISARINIPSFHPRPIPTGIIKPIDDEGDTFPDPGQFQNQANYSSTEYLAHKQEEFMRQRLEGLSSFSSPFLCSAEFGEKSAFVPQQRTNLDSYSYSTGNVNATKDNFLCSSATLPNIQMSKTDLENNNRPMSDTESSSPCIPTPAMPLLMDVKAKSRKIIHEIGTGSRPVSAEFNLAVDDLMNGMYRVESDNSVDADEPIMKHLTEGGVTILKQLERKKQPPIPSGPMKYNFPVKRILLTTDQKEKYGKGRPGNGVGMKIVGGKATPGSAEVGAYVTTIFKGGVADQLHGEVNEGDQILEWNGIVLTGKSYEDVQQIISQAPNGEVELVIKPCQISKKALGETNAQAPSCHSSYDNLDSEEENETRRHTPSLGGVDPKQLAATLEGIAEDESPCISQSSSQHDYNTASASSACSSPLSEHTSTSSEHLHAQQQQPQPSRRHDNHVVNTRETTRATATATASVVPKSNQQQPIRSSLKATNTVNNRNRYGGSQGHLQTSTQETAPIRLTPSSSDYFKRTPPQNVEMFPQQTHTAHHQQPPPQSYSKNNRPTPAERYENQPRSQRQPQQQQQQHQQYHHQKEQRRSPPRIEKQNSEKYEKYENTNKKKELGNQSNSFDEYLRLSKRAGVEDRPSGRSSPAALARTKAPSKRGLSVSSTELARRKGSETEEEIKKSPKAHSRGNRQMGDIQLQLLHDDQHNEFKVRVLQARNLLPMDLNGLSDPFVKLYLLPGRCADNKRRTKHIARTLNPEWKELLQFANVHIEELRNKTLEVTVWDYDRFKANDFLGEVVIDFSEDAFLDNLPHWYPLCSHDDTKGLDIPQPTVLPPKPNRANSASPRAISVDRHDRGPHNNNARSDRSRSGVGRRRRSFDNLQDVDRV